MIETENGEWDDLRASIDNALDSRESGKSFPVGLVAMILAIVALKNLFDVFVGGGLSIIQVLIDALLAFLVLVRSNESIRKLVIARALFAVPFWIVISVLISGIVLAIVVLLEELFISVPLLMLTVGNPGRLRKISAIAIFLVLGIGTYVAMVLIALPVMQET